MNLTFISSIQNHTIICKIPPFYAFSQSDWFGRFIVILLCFISVYAWTVMVDKYLSLNKAHKNDTRFLKSFSKGTTILEAYPEAQRSKGPVASVYLSGADKLLYLLGVKKESVILLGRQKKLPRQLTLLETEIIRNTMEYKVSLEILKLEDRLDALATAVSVSPFFGLLGTVWGVMVAFCGMAAKNTADISALAPGVSGALLTTVVGLLVAIPSLIGYNILTNYIRQLTVDMENFTMELESMLKLEVADPSNTSSHHNLDKTI